jgi:diketogulonate reductase-like aldo/keto reductase
VIFALQQQNRTTLMTTLTTTTMKADECYTLANGQQYPRIGFGTHRLRGDACVDAVVAALLAGVRRIDTASVYRNECDVGTALKIAAAKHGIARESVFVTTKIQPRDMVSAVAARRGVRRSLKALDTPYVDMLLM